jgi:hypothetical protein
MKLIFFLPYAASILFSIVVALIYRRYLRNRHLIILLPYLMYVFIQETTLWLLYYLDYYKSNPIVYNIYRPINVIVFFWVYYNIPFLIPYRKLIGWLIAIYLLATLLNYCFIESIFSQDKYLALARGFVITFYSLLFLFRYFQLDNPEEEKYWRPLLWITTGIAIFYPVVSISLTFQKYLAAEGAALYGVKLYNVIPQVMSIFMYSCFSYAFYLCRKIK